MVDLHCHSCFSFLDGASHPEELVRRAVELGYTALALTDHNGVYGSMEFAQAAQHEGLQAITGAEITLEGVGGQGPGARGQGPGAGGQGTVDPETHLTLLAQTPEGYANLCRLLSIAHRESERTMPRLPREALPEHAPGLIALSGCRLGAVPRLVDQGRMAEAERAAAQLREWFGPENFFLELQRNLVRGDTARCRALAELGRRTGIPLVATNNTHYHVRERHRLQDTLVAIRHGLSLDDAHPHRRANREFALLTPAEFRERFRDYPQAVRSASRIAERCRQFDLTRDLGYVFPDFVNEADDGQFRTADEALKLLCEEALEYQYAHAPAERREEAQRWLANELRLVKLHGLAGFFLVYRDLLQLSKEVAAELRGAGARGRFELPPGRGRGSAVSSIICYLIGLSPVDPVQAKLFPGRFLNESLETVPDIDLDFPRDIREVLIRRVHERYGWDHVAMVCIFPTYRFRGAVREVGKALALPEAELDRLARLGDGWTRVGPEMDRLDGFSRYGDHRLWGHLRVLSEELWGMPRHISQHVGGLVISSRPLVEIVPVEHSAMEGRQLCQWDKDSCDSARMIKIDFLALGMLSAVEECLELIDANDKPPVDLSRVDFTDRRVYDRICRGDTVGAFQIESRAQIGMLVRTQPRNVEDLAVQVAIVRPGPIVGNAVNPYVRQRELMRRNKNYHPKTDHPLLDPVLADTLGVIIYQDQVMEVCKHLAGFTDGEADQLRRAMSRKRSRENMERFRDMFMRGAAARNVPEEVAVEVFRKVVAFSEFGFPKSHAAAFAVLAYQSTWLLHYYPAEFTAALLNNQPMGFYSKDTLTKEAQRHGVSFEAPDLNQSALMCTVSGRTVRLGLSFVEGVGRVKGAAIVAERALNGPYLSLMDFLRRTHLPDHVAENLILVGALDRFGLNRRELLWQLGLLGAQKAHFFGRPPTWRAPNGLRWIRPLPEKDPSTFNLQPSTIQHTIALSTDQDQVEIPAAGRWERMAHDYRLLDLSVEGHPLGLLRPMLTPDIVPIRKLRRCADNSMVQAAGLVTCRQRPETAKGILFLMLEDETGMLNVVVRPELHETHRELYRGVPLLVVRGVLENKGRRLNLAAEEAWPLTESLPDQVKSAAARRAHESIQALSTPRARSYR